MFSLLGLTWLKRLGRTVAPSWHAGTPSANGVSRHVTLLRGTPPRAHPTSYARKASALRAHDVPLLQQENTSTLVFFVTCLIKI